MRSLAFAVAAATALASGMLMSGPAQAAALGPSAGTRAAIDGLNLMEDVGFVYEGRKHCWYPVGWHGPGWYWCGYAWRHGAGWGGPAGYQGWQHERRREERRELRREERREERRY